MVTKVWPEFKLEAHSYIGKDLTELAVDFTTDFTAATLKSARAPYGAIHRALQAINERAPIVMVDASTLAAGAAATATQMTVIVEGQFPVAGMAGAAGFPASSDGTTAADFGEYIEEALDDIGDVTPPYVEGQTTPSTYGLAATTVAVTRVYEAQQV